MKTNKIIKRAALLLTLSSMAALAGNANAANIYKADNADSLELGSAWVGGVAPGTDDIAYWNASAGNNPSLTLNNDLTVAGVYFVAGLTSDVTVSGQGVLTLTAQQLNSGGVARNITFKNDMILGSSNGWTTYTVAASSTMTLAGTVKKSSAVALAQTLQKAGDGVLLVSGLYQDAGTIRFDNGGGTLTISGTMSAPAAAAIICNNSAAQSTINLTGNGKFTVNGQLAVNNGNMHLNWNMDGNSELSATTLYFGWNSTANEVLNFNQSGGTTTVSGGLFLMNNNTAANTTATYTLSGSGVLAITQATVGTGGTIKLDGGTVKMLDNSTDLFKQGTTTGGGGKVIVSAGGATIDTNGKLSNADANALPFEHDASLAGKDGGLKVIGGGALFLTKVNSYDGGTVIENTILDVGANATLGAGNVVVGDNSTLNLWNNAAIDSAATLTFGANTTIMLNYGSSDTLTVAGLYDATAGTWFAANEYTAADLSAYGFGGIGTLTVLNTIPEPSAWALLLTGAALLAVVRRRK